MLDHDEAAFARLERMFSALRIADFGSLVFVPEDIWKARHAGSYDANSTRDGHPGCSLRRTSSGYSLDPVPLLHGTSRQAGRAVLVSSVLSEGHTTYFGGLPPVFVPCSSWQGKNRIIPARKSRLSPTEEASVISLCVKKGWL